MDGDIQENQNTPSNDLTDLADALLRLSFSASCSATDSMDDHREQIDEASCKDLTDPTGPVPSQQNNFLLRLPAGKFAAYT
jgi:hypothetical protein